MRAGTGEGARAAVSTFMRILAGIGLATLVLPGLRLADDRSSAALGTALPALLIGVAAALLVRRLQHRPASWLGGAAVAGAAWLLSQSRPGATEWVLAALLGAGVASALPQRIRARDPVIIGSGAVAAVAAVLVALSVGSHAALMWGALGGVALVGVAVADRPTTATARRRSAGALQIALAIAVVLVGAWIGANSPVVSWFGPTVSHGSRHGDLVALTFDDGPNSTATLEISAALVARGDRGTFFTVGKAVDRRPDISRELVAAGQLLGNHSYLHDQVRWLDPRYPELMRAERAIDRGTGRCPALFRPPHGQHTPLMTWQLHRHGMRMVTWDVSTNDWSMTDPHRVAQAILDKVRPGSIIDLHDGLDGDVTADRTVVARAVPLILAGLQARGLRSVTLDRLLGVRGYLDHC